MDKFKIGFFGTPEIAAYCLEKLSERFNIVCAVTQEDKPQKRSDKPVKPPVKILAETKNIPVLQPSDIKDAQFLDELSAYNADLFVIVAYGKIIPSSIFLLPPLKTINLHPSLLPKYRGATPVESAVKAGESATGITIQFINTKMDSGDIICQTDIVIPENFSSEEMYHEILPRGSELLIRAIEGLIQGTVAPIPQNEAEATYCSKISKESAEIDWNSGAKQIHNLIRAYNPKPVAWTTFRSHQIRIRNSVIPPDINEKLRSGELKVYAKKRLIAGTGNGVLEIMSIQPEGKKNMDAASFINGYKPVPEEIFGR